MSLVRRYVHEAGGRIALASLKGHETRFKVTMPRLEAASPQEAAAAQAVA
jgi:signal transduction histidine kinase